MHPGGMPEPCPEPSSRDYSAPGPIFNRGKIWVNIPSCETHFLERQRPSVRVAKEFFGIHRLGTARHPVLAGNQVSPRQGRATLARLLHDLLEHRGKKGLFRYRHLHKNTPPSGHAAYGDRTARPGSTRPCGRVSGLFSCQRICCLLYTSDAADEEDSVDLGGRGIIKKK